MIVENVRILLIEDNPGDARLIEEELRDVDGAAFEMKHADCLLRGMECLERGGQDIVLLDLSLPDSSGLETVEKAIKIAHKVPIIVLTGMEDEWTAMKALQAGAHNYLVKNELKGALLYRSIRYAIERTKTLAKLEEKTQELKINEALFRKIIEQNADAIVILDRRGSIRFANPAAEKLYGKKADELHGDWFGKDFTDGQTATLRVNRRDGSQVAAEMKVVKIDWEGEPGFLASLRDVTELKAAQAKTEMMEQILRLLNRRGSGGRSVRDVLMVLQERLDIETLAVRVKKNGDFPFYVTRGLPARLHQEGNSLLKRDEDGDPVLDDKGRPVLRCLCGDVLSGRRAEGGDGFSAGGSFWTNSRKNLVSSNGRTRPTLCHESGFESVAIVPLRADNDVVGILQLSDRTPGRFTAADIAFFERVGEVMGIALARLWAEEALAHSERKLRTIFEFANQGILMIDFDERRLTLGNKRILDQTGYRQDQIENLFIDDLHPESELPRIREEYERLLRGEVEIMKDVPIKRCDGSIFFAEVNGSRMNAGGKRFFVGFYRDVTDRVKAETALKESEEQLRQSQKMEAVGRLAGGVAHDFNNLMTVVTGYSELALGRLTEQDDRLRRDLEEIRKSGEKASNLTRQLLAFSRRQVMKPKIINLNHIVRDMEKMLKRLIGEHIAFQTHLDPKIERVKADPGQVEQVILNMAVNARDAMADGGDLTIETSNFSADPEYTKAHGLAHSGPFVVLHITDTGHGIPNDIKTRIFEPFFTTKEKGRGTGLGLSMVYGIVKQSGGFVGVDSQPDQGTTFKIYLPAILELSESVTPAPRPVTKRRGSERILVVEDEKGVLDLVSEVLHSAGYEVMVAGDGRAALDKINACDKPFHLLLTDVVMPGMSGKELSEKVESSYPGIRTLFMSGYTDDAIVHHGVLESGCSFLEKPFTPDHLLTTIRDLLDGKLED